MQGKPIVFVDVETDGVSHIGGHVIEIAAIKVVDGEVVDTFQTLINPGIEIPSFITELTGIDTAAVAGAPQFATIADELHGFFADSLFAAHNVWFDYSFLREEFGRTERHFQPPMFCTVRLSRALYPAQYRHRLSDLIAAHQFNFAARHRAYDDAYVLVQFWRKVHDEFGAEAVAIALQSQRKTMWD